MIEESIKLTQYAHGAGCGCKIAPQVLEEILKTDKAENPFQNLLVGNQLNDDAAVYKMNDQEALIATTDFFTPIVNDPFIFGKVAAANAISDIYAMGGQPILALAILGWPVQKLSVDLAREVLDGAREVCAQAGIPLAGGHSIDSREPIFGLTVNGKVKTRYLKQNNTAKAGDLLLLTKPLGVGILSTAAKREQIEVEDLTILHDQLVQLNKIGVDLGRLEGVRAMTDVTGFGLGGHLIEMTEASGLSAVLYDRKIPRINGLKKYLDKNILPDATYRNWNAMSAKIKFGPSANSLDGFKLLPDPQTNGGLLIAADPDRLGAVQEVLDKNGYRDFIEPIGKMTSKAEMAIVVE